MQTTFYQTKNFKIIRIEFSRTLDEDFMPGPLKVLLEVWSLGPRQISQRGFRPEFFGLEGVVTDQRKNLFVENQNQNILNLTMIDFVRGHKFSVLCSLPLYHMPNLGIHEDHLILLIYLLHHNLFVSLWSFSRYCKPAEIHACRNIHQLIICWLGGFDTGMHWTKFKIIKNAEKLRPFANLFWDSFEKFFPLNSICLWIDFIWGQPFCILIFAGFNQPNKKTLI